MYRERMDYLIRTIIAAGAVEALPVGVSWPVHRAVLMAVTEAARLGLPLDVTAEGFPDPDTYRAVPGVEAVLGNLALDGFMAIEGAGYTARWVVDTSAAALARRELFALPPETAGVLTYAGQRLATWASTALKNAETAAASWRPHVEGPTPTVRQPPLVAVR